MNLIKLSAVAEILSSIAIVATLIYLAIQTEQNTAAIQANTRQAMLVADQAVLTLVVENPGISLDYYEPELDDEDKARLGAFFSLMVRVRENNWLQYQNGSIDERTWESYRRALISTFSQPRSRAWWYSAVAGQNAYDQGFVDEVSALLAETEISETIWHSTIE